MKNEDPNKHTEKILVTIWKRKLNFYGHLVRIEKWLTKNIFKYIIKDTRQLQSDEGG